MNTYERVVSSAVVPLFWNFFEFNKMEKIGIAKLTNDNYDSWKLEVEFLLVREVLWKYVSPGVKPMAAANGANAGKLAT